MDAADTIGAGLRAALPDRHLAVLYAPADRRAALTALYAFDAEIGTLRGKVREPLAGEIRLRWWSDALAAPSGERSGNPVADALREAIAAHRLPIAAFERLLEARIFDLYDDPMPDRAALEGYLGETRSAVVQLAMLILDPIPDQGAAPRFAEAAGHGGCALGIVELLAALPTHRRRGQCYIPADMLAAAGADRDALLAGAPGAGRAVEAMAALGRDHLGRFRASAQGLPATLAPAFLPLATVGVLLDRTARMGRAALDQPARISPLRRHWLMLRRAATGW